MCQQVLRSDIRTNSVTVNGHSRAAAGVTCQQHDQPQDMRLCTRWDIGDDEISRTSIGLGSTAGWQPLRIVYKPGFCIRTRAGVVLSLLRVRSVIIHLSITTLDTCVERSQIFEAE